MHKILVILCKKVFGEFSAKTKFDGKTHITRFPAVIGTALEIAGVPRMDKRLISCFVPKDILKGSIKMQAMYLRRVFDDEGDVCFDKYGKRAVRITRSVDVTNKNIEFPLLKNQKWTFYKNPNIPINNLYGEQLLLRKLGIDAKIYPEGVYKSLKNRITAKSRIQVGQQDSLRRFSDIINFNLKEKRIKLYKALKSFKVREFPNGKGEEFVIETLKNICKTKVQFTFSDLGIELEKIGRTYDLAGYYLRILQNKGVIKKIKRGMYEFK